MSAFDPWGSDPSPCAEDSDCKVGALTEDGSVAISFQGLCYATSSSLQKRCGCSESFMFVGEACEIPTNGTLILRNFRFVLMSIEVAAILFYMFTIYRAKKTGVAKGGIMNFVIFTSLSSAILHLIWGILFVLLLSEVSNTLKHLLYKALLVFIVLTCVSVLAQLFMIILVWFMVLRAHKNETLGNLRTIPRRVGILLGVLFGVPVLIFLKRGTLASGGVAALPALSCSLVGALMVLRREERLKKDLVSQMSAGGYLDPAQVSVAFPPPERAQELKRYEKTKFKMPKVIKKAGNFVSFVTGIGPGKPSKAYITYRLEHMRNTTIVIIIAILTTMTGCIGITYRDGFYFGNAGTGISFFLISIGVELQLLSLYIYMFVTVRMNLEIEAKKNLVDEVLPTTMVSSRFSRGRFESI